MHAQLLGMFGRNIILQFKRTTITIIHGASVMDFSYLRDRAQRNPWEQEREHVQARGSINLAPLKGALENDPVRSKVLKILIDDGSWVSTADLLRAAKQVRPVIGAVTIGTIMNGMNDLVSSRLIISRTSMNSGIDWAEWRINPDWLEPTRRLLQMITRCRARDREKTVHDKVQRLLGCESSDTQ